ncbi:MAG: biotin--[acetyl-CoA-carboxylase] ligase [bacterium]
MSDTILWGTGLNGVADTVSPDLLIESAWKVDIEELAPWYEATFICEGSESRSWISGKPWESFPLLITGHCSSCLDAAWYLCRRGIFPEGSSLLALSQWAGRGQFGRKWHSPAGNLYSAWHVPYSAGPFSAMLSLLVGYVIIQGLIGLGVKVELKWPNDLVFQRKKIGGILIEERGGAVMAGIGINLVSNLDTCCLRGSHALSSGSLRDFGYDFRPLNLWRRLVIAGQKYYHEIIRSCTPADFTSLLQPYLAFMGEEVMVEDYRQAAPYHGRIMGLGAHGGLRIWTVGREKFIQSGSIYPLKE